MFEREKIFVQANKEMLRENYPDKYLVIIGEQIIGTYNTVGEAYQEAIKNYELGSFMIQQVPAKPENDIFWLSPFAYARVF